MTPYPEISVVVPTYQRCASIKRLLHALSHQSLPADQFEVIISIDGSIDGTRELVEQTQFKFTLKSLWQPNQGRATACNNGINDTQGELIVILDDDMEPASQLLEAHWNAHIGRTHLGVVGAVPVQLELSSTPVMQYIGSKFNQHLERLAQPGYILNLRDFYSGNFSILRSELLEVGLFDSHFKEYGNEDLELSFRLKQAGIQLVFSQEAVAIQHYEKDFPSLAKDNIAKGRTSVLFARLHPEAISELKLSTYNQESAQWRFVRSLLLGLSQLWKSTPQAVLRCITWLEKRHPVHLELYYRFSLDYFYWLGVRNTER